MEKGSKPISSAADRTRADRPVRVVDGVAFTLPVGVWSGMETSGVIPRVIDGPDFPPCLLKDIADRADLERLGNEGVAAVHGKYDDACSSDRSPRTLFMALAAANGKSPEELNRM